MKSIILYYILLITILFIVLVKCEINEINDYQEIEEFKGGICDDRDPCTIDKFKLLRCDHIPKCVARDKCEIATCNRKNGNCTVVPKCVARNVCEQALCDVNSGTCIYTPTCVSGDRCSVASCNATNGECSIQPKCKTEEICDDRGFCVNCSDGNPCTTDFYSPYYGICINIINEWANCEGTPEYQRCIKGCITNNCTNAVCEKQNLTCVKSYKDCSDGNLCTMDFCDPVMGCVHQNISCSDGNPCTIDFCDNEYGCHHEPDPICDAIKQCSSNKDCTDNMDCTTDHCDKGLCYHTLNCGFDQLCNSQYKCEKVRFEN